MNIQVRVDDYPHHSRHEPQHTPDAFRQFNRELKLGIGSANYLLGVIPGQCTPEDLLLLRRETDCEFGMHGIVHDEAKLDLYQNEFAPYLPRQKVKEQIAEAVNAMDAALGRRTHVYMPPRNRIDRRTIDAIRECKFLAYTTGPETAEEFTTGPQRSYPCYLPSFLPYEYGRTDELLQRGAVDELKRNGGILALHWTWEVNIGLHHMRKFFEQFEDKSIFGSWDFSLWT